VGRALALVAAAGFTASCLPEVGRLLATLAAGVRGGTIGEVGAGCGVGTAWLASALAPGVALVTVERDPARAATVAALFAAYPAVRVLHDDWRTVRSPCFSPTPRRSARSPKRCSARWRSAAASSSMT